MYTNSGGFNNEAKIKVLNTSASKIKRPSSATARDKGKKIIGLVSKTDNTVNISTNIPMNLNASTTISNEFLKEQFNMVLNKNNNLYNKFLEFLVKK